MQGLPPDPVDTIRLITEADVDGARESFGLSFLVPDLALADDAWLHSFLGNYQILVAGDLLNCMSDHAELVTCRTDSTRPASPRFEIPFAPNHGAHPSVEALAIAVGVYVTSGRARRGGGSRVRLPACPPRFVSRGRELTSDGAGFLISFCNSLVAWASGQVGPTGANVILGTIRRQAGGAPLATAVFDPAFSVRPSLRVEVLRRRLPKRGQLSPP